MRSTGQSPSGDSESGEGRPRAIDELLPQVYDNLRSVARRYLSREPACVTIRPTTLVHEAYVRLAGRTSIDWQGKTHVLAVAATEMRRILVEHARAAQAQKRGGRPQRLTLDDQHLLDHGRTVELLSLDASLQALEERSSRQARVVELRVFSGMLVREIAHVLDVSERTVKGDWQMARAWLARELAVERDV